MTRAIKFRAWDTVQDQMLPVEAINFREDLISLNEGDNSVTDSSEMFILMQYTGLADRNGQEIYEGDILATWNDDPEFDDWEKSDFGYTVVIWDANHTRFRGSLWTWTDDGGSVYCMDFVEVIGSIYEHPELLKEDE